MPATSTALPPPVKGWDARESIADMPDDHAVIMDNWFPETDKIMVRKGHASHATGMSGNVETLIEYVPQTGTAEMFAANAGDIYDVTAAGAIGAAVSTGHSNNRWQYVAMGNVAGQFIRLFNGQDTPLLYNGTTWATTAITGPTAINLIWCDIHQRRMWFGEIDSLSAWYLPVNTVSGAATEFSLAGIAHLGGYIMGMGTWTRDSGTGMDDIAVFVTSEGEAIVYSGTDPSAAATWSLIGVFRIGKPIGRRCMVKAGSDLIIVTQDGFVPLASILTMDRSQTRLVSLSDQIASAVNKSVRAGGTLYGWQPIVYPQGTRIIFNIPQTTTTFYQYVFNTITGAPTRFTGMNAVCWSLLNDNLYFGGTDGVVYKADTGASDNGSAIESDVLQAFSYFKSPGTKKVFKMVEPIFEGEGNPNAAIDFNVDYQIKAPTGVASAAAVNSGLWGVSKWGIALWGSAGQIYRGWRGVRGVGRAGSIRIRISSLTSTTSWIATNYTYVKGGQV